MAPPGLCRMSTSDMIHMMFSECKPDSEDYIWYAPPPPCPAINTPPSINGLATCHSVNDGRGFHTYGLLIVSTLFTVLITVFTFGIKVCAPSPRGGHRRRWPVTSQIV